MTNDELQAAIAVLATKADLEAAIRLLATKAELQATRAELQAAIAPLATKAELQAAIAPLATKAELQATGAELQVAIVARATQAEVREEGERTRRHFDVVAEGLRGDIRLVGEGQVELRQRVDALGKDLRRDIARLDHRVTRLEASRPRSRRER